MTKVELSLWIEANYQISGTGRPRKPLYGVGVNDAHYATQPVVNGKQIKDPAYSAWLNMLKRSYNQKYHAEHPTYSDVTVCKDWHSFIAFRVWWLDNHQDGLNLDKDLLVVGNREYSTWSCLYIPQWLNKFTTDSGAARGDLPIGVCFHNQTGLYRSECSNPITGKHHTIGYFTTPAAAHDAWLRYKLELADELKPRMDAIDKRIYPNVVTIIKAAQ